MKYSQKAFVADDIGTASIFERRRCSRKAVAHRLAAAAFLVVVVGAAAATVAVAAPVAAAAAEPAATVGETGDIVAVASAFVAEAKAGTVGFGFAAAAATSPVSGATGAKSAAAEHHPASYLAEASSALVLNCSDPERKSQKHDVPWRAGFGWFAN